MIPFKYSATGISTIIIAKQDNVAHCSGVHMIKNFRVRGTNTDCLFVHAKVFVFVLFFVWPILSMSLDCPFFINLIGGVMIRVFASSAVDRGFEPRSGQTRDYTIDLCCFSAKHSIKEKEQRLLGSESE